MNEQVAVDLPRASVLSLEDELHYALREREPEERPARFRAVLERRVNEITVSRVLNMGSSIAAQWCIWWLMGRTIESLGRDEDPGDLPIADYELRSLVRESRCPTCQHEWAGTEREPCPECGCAPAKIVRGEVKPFAYKVGLVPGNAKDVRAREMRGESNAIVKHAKIDQDGRFRVRLRDALVILRRYGLGVRQQEWYLRAGQSDGPRESTRKPKNWPIRDRCIVVEVAHESLLARNVAARIVES